MDLGLRGRVALVCGGSSGLGYAVAERLLGEGSPRRPERARPGQARPRRLPTLLAGRSTRLARRREPCLRVLCPRQRCPLQAMGGPDIVLCNSGGPSPGAFEAHNEAAWQAAPGHESPVCRALEPFGRDPHASQTLGQDPVPDLRRGTAAFLRPDSIDYRPGRSPRLFEGALRRGGRRGHHGQCPLSRPVRDRSPA